MLINELHSWDVDREQALDLQRELSKRVIIQDFSHSPRLIAGADVGYSQQDNTLCAAVIVFEFPNLNPVEEATAIGKTNFPYIPGLLTFREAPILLAAFRKLESTPDVAIFDGQGIAHHRKIGLASHIGLWLGIPSIGCAKKRLVGKHDTVGPKVGDRADLWFKEELLGCVVRTRRNVKPLYISPGYLINLDKSIEIVLQTTRGFRLPEPTRKAHITVNQISKHH